MTFLGAERLAFSNELSNNCPRFFTFTSVLFFCKSFVFVNFFLNLALSGVLAGVVLDE
jgi:hypothetical protein